MGSKKTLKELIYTPGKMVIAPGAYDGISARLVAEAGYEAVYMTGAGTAASKLGQPDLGLITLTEMVSNAAMISDCTELLVIADADTGYGSPLNVIRTVREYERAGVSAIQLEDQNFPKRCGHLDGKEIIGAHEFSWKIKAAVDTRKSEDFLIIARTDARTVYGFEDAVERVSLYSEAGADILFVESPTTMDEMTQIPKLLDAPCLINMAGPLSKTPAITSGELRDMGYKIAIFPAVAMDAAVIAIRRALKILNDQGISWDPENLLGPQKLFEAMGLESWKSWEEKYHSSKEGN